MLDSPPSAASDPSGTKLFYPPRGLLSQMVQNRIINQPAWLYLHLRSLSTSSPTKITVQGYDCYPFSNSQVTLILCLLWEQGICKNFSSPYNLNWISQPSSSRKKEELKELYSKKILNLPGLIREILIKEIPTSRKIDWEAIASSWSLKFSELWIGMRSLEKKGELTLSLTGVIAITWHSPQSPGVSREELTALQKNKTLSTKGFTLLACKCLAPIGGTLDCDRLSDEWGIDSTKLFEELALYQSRAIARIQIDRLYLDWLPGGMPLYMDRITLEKRRAFFREHGLLWMILRCENPTGVQHQYLEPDSIASFWKLKPQDLIRWLARLTKAEVFNTDLGKVRITWYW